MRNPEHAVECLDAEQWSALAREHGAVRREHLKAAACLLTLAVTLPVFAATMLIDYYLVHSALSFVLFSSESSVDVLALSSVLCVAALHALWVWDDNEGKDRLQRWLPRLVRQSVRIYLLGFGWLLAYVSLSNADVALDPDPLLLPSQDWSLPAIAKEWATSLFEAVKAAGGLIGVVLGALGIAGVFILSVFTGHVCVCTAFGHIRWYLDVAPRFVTSARLLRQIRQLERACTEASHRASAARQRSDADIVRTAMAALTAVADEALLPHRQADRTAQLSPLNREGKHGAIEVPGLRELFGFGQVDAQAFHEVLEAVEKSVAADQLGLIALSVSLDREGHDSEEPDNG